ncbi:hypothetical protein REPUB_Repub04eG0144400 [Reevesia pubescens]
MCVESCKNSSVVRGSFLVKPKDELFWFGRPKWILHLLQLVLIQNSFQLAFFAWSWILLQSRNGGLCHKDCDGCNCAVTLRLSNPATICTCHPDDDVQPGTRGTPTPKISKEKAKAKMIESYDGEISFGSSWRKSEPGLSIREITPVIEEDTSSSILTNLDDQHMNIS